MKTTGILETALYCENLDAAEIFYGRILGLELEQRSANRHVFFRCGPGMLLIFNPRETVEESTNEDLPVPPHGSTGEGHVCFGATAEELDAILDVLEEHEIFVEADFNWPNGARSIYIRDPAGNSVEFAEPRLWNFKE